MAKKDKKKSVFLNPETKNSIVAVFLLGVAVILMLASFGKAGPAGEFTYNIFKNLFGWGYFLLPIIFVGVAMLFFFSKQRTLVSTSLIGAAMLIVAGLGFIDINFENRGGLLGQAIGFLEIPFGHIASIIITLLLAIAAVLITFNASIKFKQVDQSSAEASEGAERLSEEIDEVVIAEPEGSKPAKNKKMIEKDLSEEEPVIATPAVATAFGTKKIKTNNAKLLAAVKYTPPPADLLKSSVEKPTSGDLRGNANIIKRTLESFGIPVEMGEINIGPKVTRYTLKPAEGVKISKITALNSDLALALAAHPIRIEAPIPGKSLVGIEVPNKSAAIVRLGSLIAYSDFKDSGPLNFVLGRGVSGEVIMADIEKMPHILVAGATGSGKSVSIHALILSLIYKNSPATLRLAMIDPKRVELSIYRGLPHLISPVITEGKKAIGLFRWAIQEMERRYEVLLEAGARDIRSYNQKNSVLMPYIVMIVDELADLMAAYGKEIEGSIVRLAQMARATGIHLVVSTQRPSVEVITGLIKANITARIALQVASQVDSRTILDTAGAEKLLGGGDMLFISSEFSKPKRIQGAYVSEEEIKGVAKFIEDHNDPIDAFDYLPEAAKSGDGSVTPSDFLDNWSGDDGDNDQALDQAIQVVKEAKKASASLLQRRLKVGYARAARLLDIMEEKGLIGPGEGAKPREVFVSNDSPEPPTVV